MNCYEMECMSQPISLHLCKYLLNSFRYIALHPAVSWYLTDGAEIYRSSSFSSIPSPPRPAQRQRQPAVLTGVSTRTISTGEAWSR
ncbi:MAG: hypothetical protein RMN51_01040 [Verrucomicrobiota bacterium]|nr:hypothetical protein [Verrucomicrobiota bacterium]